MVSRGASRIGGVCTNTALQRSPENGFGNEACGVPPFTLLNSKLSHSKWYEVSFNQYIVFDMSYDVGCPLVRSLLVVGPRTIRFVYTG